MIVPEPDVRLDSSDRLERAFRAVPYVLLAVSTLLSLADDLIEHRPAAYRLGTLAVAVVAAGWMLWWVTLHPDWARRRRAVAMAEALRPDVVLMDLRMPRLDGATAIARLAERGVDAKVLVLTTCHELFRAVGAAGRGESVLSPSVASRLLGQVRAPVTEPLTQRELEVLQLVARARPTGRRPGACSSARPASRPTCCTSTPSSASTTEPPPWPPPTNEAC